MPTLILAVDEGGLTEVGGLSVLRRLVRTAVAAGQLPVSVIATSDAASVHREIERAAIEEGAGFVAASAGSELAAVRAAWPPDADACLVTPADVVLDQRLLPALAERVDAALVDSAPPESLRHLLDGAATTPAGRLCGPAMLSRRWLDTADGALAEATARGLDDGSLAAVDVASLPDDSASLRRRLRPLWLRTPEDPTRAGDAERLLIAATKKGCPDLPAVVHTPLEAGLVRLLAPTPISPNQITVLGTVLAFLATACFATGRLGVGLALALVVGVLDGVDGRLARLRLQTSRFGELEHHIDALYELSWWLALGWHFYSSGAVPDALALLVLLGVAEALDGVAKIGVLRATGRHIDEASGFDRAVRLFGGRRNVYVWILTAGWLLGNPAAAFELIPWWELMTAAVHLPRAWWIVRRARRPAAAHVRATTEP